MVSEKFISMTQDECVELEGGAIAPIILPILKGVAYAFGIIRGGITIHNFLEDVVYEASYEAAYKAEMSRLKNE